MRPANGTGPYLDDDVLPVDPWDNAYEYEYPPTNNKRDFPDIWSLGPDGEADTDDDIVNWRQGSGEAGEEEGMTDGGPRDAGTKVKCSSSSGGGGSGREQRARSLRNACRSSCPPPALCRGKARLRTKQA